MFAYRRKERPGGGNWRKAAALKDTMMTMARGANK
jgi:hypothetical protein